MPTVKGSKQEKMVVVPYRPLRTFFIRIGLLVTAAAFACGGYFYGQYRTINENIEIRLERDQLTQELQGSRNQLAYLQQELVNMEQASSIDREALQEVQTSLVNLREVNAQLEEDVLFYRQVMSPDNAEDGLIIGQLDLWAAGAESRIGYRLELRQLANNENMIEGYANVNVVGQQGGNEVSLPLHSLSIGEVEENIRIGFRYFQNIEGEMIIPDGFVPEQIRIRAVDEGNEKTVERNFAWLVDM